KATGPGFMRRMFRFGAARARSWHSCAGFVATPMAVVRFRSTARRKRMVGCTLGGGGKGRSVGPCTLRLHQQSWMRGRCAEERTSKIGERNPCRLPDRLTAFLPWRTLAREAVAALWREAQPRLFSRLLLLVGQPSEQYRVPRMRGLPRFGG